MGTKCAPTYANTSMSLFEKNFIFQLLTNFNDFYQRFVDDIFLIWIGTKTEFDDFLKNINEMPKREINFLNTAVFKVDNKLRTKMYVKSTDRHVN